MQMDIRRRVRQRLPELVGVAVRFPLAVLAALALAAYHVFDVHLTPHWDVEIRTVRVPAALACGFLWAVLATLVGEARGLDALTRIALGAAGWFLVALVFVAARALDLQPLTLIAGLLLALTVAAYARRGVRNAELWQFNHTMWAGALVAVIAMLLSAGGISTILESLRYLFGIDLPRRLHDKVWVIAGFVVGPVYWLSLVPRDFHVPVAMGEPQDFVSRAIAVLARFILVPILVAYAAILHAYAVKIGIDQALPKGRIGWLVLSYGIAMATTALAVYPTRDTGGALVRTYAWVWPWLLPVPVVLLLLAVGARIGQYGLTDHRYLVVLGALWLASLVLTQGLRGRAADLRFITGPLAVLLLLASLGPWGVLGFPVRQQASEMRTRLAAAGLLQDGRIVPASRPAAQLPRADRHRLAGIIDYLNRNARLTALEPVFQGDAHNPFAGTPPSAHARYDLALADRVRERLGLDRNTHHTERRVVSYTGAAAVSVPIAAGGHLVGPLTLHTQSGNRSSPREIATAHGLLRVQLEASVLTVSAAEPIATFDLAALWGENGPIPKETDLKPVPAPPLVVGRTTGATSASLVITNVIGNALPSGAVEVSHVSFWLLLASAR